MMERTIFDVAADTDTTADDRDYEVPFRFTARLASNAMHPVTAPACNQVLNYIRSS